MGGARHAGMSRTSIARVYEIISYKMQQEKTVGPLSAERLAMLYKDADKTQPQNFSHSSRSNGEVTVMNCSGVLFGPWLPYTIN
jgi:hypothetical protein